MSGIKNLYIDRKYFYFLLGMCFCFGIVLSLHTLQVTLSETRQDINYQTLILKKDIGSALDTAKHVLKGIALSIVPYDNSKYEIIRNFDLRNYNQSKLKFSALVLTDENNNSLAVSSLSQESFYSINFNNAKCLRYTKEQPNVVHIEELSVGRYSKEPILPLGIGLEDKNGRYKGAICTGLSLNNLNDLLTNGLNTDTVQSINIQQYSNVNSTYPNLTNYNLLINLLKSEKFIIELPLGIKSYTLSALVNKQKIVSQICKRLFFNLLAVVFAGAMLGIFYYIIRKFYSKPLSRIKDSLLTLYIAHEKSLEGETVYSIFNRLITEVDSFYIKERQKLEEEKKEYIEKQILYSALIERSYAPASFYGKFNEANLIKRVLYYLLKESKQNIVILDSIQEAINYCTEYFGVEITLRSSTDAGQTLVLHKNIFEETLFLLIEFVLRTGMFNEGIPIKFSIDKDMSSDIIIIISIELCNFSRSTTWEDSPMTAFSSLYSIFLLLKENSLFFDVYKEGNVLNFKIFTQ